MLVEQNPLLRDQSLLFVKRYSYDSRHYYDDYYNGIRQFGGSLCELSLDEGAVRDILPELNEGIFDRYDLSFDAKRVVFGYRRPLPEGFRVWEANLDGSGLRQLTLPPEDEEERVRRNSYRSHEQLCQDPALYGHWTDDMHPCYLPDGRIAFVSSRPERENLIVATGCGHEPLAVGSIVLIDLQNDKRSPEAMTSLTPQTRTEGLRGFYQYRNGRWIAHDVFGPFYCDPYPLSDEFFLAPATPTAGTTIRLHMASICWTCSGTW